MLCLLRVFPAGSRLRTRADRRGERQECRGASGRHGGSASPALIEKVRSAVTDGQGVYRITELRPGEYGRDLLDGRLHDGPARRHHPGDRVYRERECRNERRQRRETVIVSGASPIVDTSNVRTQIIVQRAELDALPLAKSFMGYNALIPGMKAARRKWVHATSAASLENRR